MNDTQVAYPDCAFITRGKRPDVLAGRTDDLVVSCPECGKNEDIAFLASADVSTVEGKFIRDSIAWCPCGCVFVLDKGKSTRVYSFFTHQ